MHAPYDPPPSGPLTDLVRARDEEFNKRKYRRLESLTLRYIKDSDDPERIIHDYRIDFFVLSLMYHEAWRHDRQTAERAQKYPAAKRERFFARRLVHGIRHIRKRTGFDLSMPVHEAFSFYAQGLEWQLLHLLRRRKKDGHVSLDEGYAWLLPMCFDPDLTDRERWATVKLAIADLPRTQQELARRVAEGSGFHPMTPALLRALFVMRENLRTLYLAHDMAQSLQGRNLIARATTLIDKPIDASLVFGHFTVSGPGCSPDLFSGQPLDVLSTPAEKLDHTGDKVRFRLLRALAQISALLEEPRYDALLSLPCAQRSVLKIWPFQRDLNASDTLPPAMTPAAKQRAIREAYRDMRRLHQLYRRAGNGKSLYDLIHHSRLTQDERDLLTLLLVKRQTLDKIAELKQVSIEVIKERLLAAATKVIDLEN